MPSGVLCSLQGDDRPQDTHFSSDVVYHEVSDVCTDPHPGPGVGLVICPQSTSVCTLSTARGLNCNRLRHNFLPLQRPRVSGDAGEAVGISRTGLGQVDSGLVGIFCVLPSPSTKSQPCATSLASQQSTRVPWHRHQKCVAQGVGRRCPEPEAGLQNVSQLSDVSNYEWRNTRTRYYRGGLSNPVV